MMEENESELADRLDVLWKRRWLIVIPTVCLAVLAGAASFLLPPKWEIDALIQPSKFLAQTGAGGFLEVVVSDPKQIAAEINQRSYDELISAELKIDPDKFPRIEAENLKDTRLVKVSVLETDVQRGKDILRSLFRHLKTSLDTKINVEIDNIDSEIRSKQLDKQTKEKEIAMLDNKLAIMNQREKALSEEIGAARARIKQIESAQLETLKKRERGEAQDLGLLLYANEVQLNYSNLDTLSELLSTKKLEREDLQQERKQAEQAIESLDNSILNLTQKKGRIDYARLVKQPTSSLHPVAPKKKLNILIAGVFGGLLFTLLAFFLEIVERKKPE